MIDLSKKRILVTGAKGFLGKHVLRELQKSGIPQKNIISVSSSDADLRIDNEAKQLIKNISPNIVIALAARLGGIGDNRAYPASYFYDNLMIGINTIEASRKYNVEKLLSIGTVCSYPKILKVPFKEEDLWKGYPEETNAPYGIAKKAVMEYGISVYHQYDFVNVNLLLTNLYGPEDDFRDATSHVIPAIIKKIMKAKEEEASEITAWGDGSPTRDFLFVEDAAEAIVRAAKYHDKPQPVNIGSGREVSIKHLIEQIKRELNFDGKIIWDKSKPNGQPRRILNTSKAKELFGFQSKTDFNDGLRKTIQWYRQNRTEIDRLPPKYQRS